MKLIPKESSKCLLEDVIEHCQKVSSVVISSPELLPFAKIEDLINPKHY